MSAGGGCSSDAGSLTSTAKEPGADDFGSVLIPPLGSYVLVFFEDEDPDKPVYVGGLILDDPSHMPVEQTHGKEYWKRHTLIKTPTARTIFLSDDVDLPCTVITGWDLTHKKRKNNDDPRRDRKRRFDIWEKKKEEYMMLLDELEDYILFDEVKKRIRLQHHKGAYVEYDQQGNIHIEARAGVFINCKAGVHEKPPMPGPPPQDPAGGG